MRKEVDNRSFYRAYCASTQDLVRRVSVQATSRDVRAAKRCKTVIVGSSSDVGLGSGKRKGRQIFLFITTIAVVLTWNFYRFCSLSFVGSDETDSVSSAAWEQVDSTMTDCVSLSHTVPDVFSVVSETQSDGSTK